MGETTLCELLHRQRGCWAGKQRRFVMSCGCPMHDVWEYSKRGRGIRLFAHLTSDPHTAGWEFGTILAHPPNHLLEEPFFFFLSSFIFDYFVFHQCSTVTVPRNRANKNNSLRARLPRPYTSQYEHIHTHEFDTTAITDNT